MPSSERIVDFLNQLPITSDRDQWVKQLMTALHTLCPDVDRISINIDVLCDPYREEKAEDDETAFVIFTKNGEKKSLTLLPETGLSHTSMFEQEFALFADLSKYNPPAFFHYFLKSGSYIGTITYLREIEKTPISEGTKDVLASLEPFIIFVFASFISSQKYVEPFTTSFRDALAQMRNDAEFSEQEQSVMVLKLAGYSYKMIAAHMDISLNTVRSHIKSIHRKTGTRSYTELFAKYFTPLARDFLP